ncbi:MAG: hypothetical protein K1X52_09225 [Pyrinomonadaceae bacterium]|nr:hypothetical protein [Pyrinomonadaceae bacterium]
MPDVLIRNVDPKVLAKLKARAKKSGRSLQGELAEVFRSLAGEDLLSDGRTADRIKERLRRSGRTFSDSAEILREHRHR